MDIFEKKEIKPMLISRETEPFDSKDYIFELKLDGIRCVAYLSKDECEIRNKRNKRLIIAFPELNDINKMVKKKCILDGELIVAIDGKPNFNEVRRRESITDNFKIKLAALKHPASFVAYDILYLNDKQVTELPLMERKDLINKTVNENERIAISRYIEEKGIDLYNLTVDQKLEGIVGKKKDSKYYFDKRTNDWIKIKYLLDDDFVICGYIVKSKTISSLILGQYNNNELEYKGHVTIGISGRDFMIISNHNKRDTSPFLDTPKGNEEAVWIEPNLVGAVMFMARTETGFLRQPVFKGLRKDKLAKECSVSKK